MYLMSLVSLTYATQIARNLMAHRVGSWSAGRQNLTYSKRCLQFGIENWPA